MLPSAARNTPTVIEGLTGVVAISAGEDRSLFLKDDGTVWAWGKNPEGQPGTGTMVALPGRESPPVAVAFGAGLQWEGSTRTITIKP